MKTSINMLLLILLAQNLNGQLNEYSVDKIQSNQKQLRIGVSTGYIMNRYTSRAFHLGVITEYATSNTFAFEFELSAEHRDFNLARYNQGRKKDLNIDFASSAKYFIGLDKNYYLKLGYYINRILYDIELENYVRLDFDPRLHSGIQFTSGYQFQLTDKITSRIEPIIRYKDFEEFYYGLKIGALF